MPDYDDQSDAPDLGASVQLENSETMEGPPGADPLDAGYVPPDRPYALDDDRTETLDDRLAAELPEDVVDAQADRAGRLTDDDGDDMDAVDVGVDGGAASAEEAAVHDVDVDTRVDGEPSVAADPELLDPDVEAEIDGSEDALARRDAGRDLADTLDRAVDGSAAGASGRTDAGPVPGL